MARSLRSLAGVLYGGVWEIWGRNHIFTTTLMLIPTVYTGGGRRPRRQEKWGAERGQGRSGGGEGGNSAERSEAERECRG